MRRFIYILLFLLSLPFREGAGSVYASYFEVQVPMSDKQAQTQMFSHQPLATGHFSTTVNTLDPNGHAYSPGQSAVGNSGPHHAKKVSHDDDEDDPFMGNVVPIGETPFALFALLLLAYMTVRLRDRRKKASF